MRTRILSLMLLLVTAGLAAADQPVLKNDHYEIYLTPGSKVVSRQDRGYQTLMVVEQAGQRVRINWDKDRARILFPTSTLRLETETVSQRMSTVTAYLDGQTYKFKTTRSEVSWLLPDQQIYFRTRGGTVSQVAGPKDFLRLRRQTLAGRITLESGAGTTDALINEKGKLERFDGPEIDQHLYLVRGFSLDQGPISVRLPLPNGPFLSALPPDRYFRVSKEMVALPGPPDRTPVEKAKDPLQADPYTWGSPELRARSGDESKDPLSVRKERRVTYPEDPLRAKGSADSEEVLRAKNY